MQTVKTLQISFSLPITASEIRQWRGAFIEMAGWQDDVFHNHANESQTDENGNNKVVKTHQKYHYRYPMVQYRVHRGKAAVFAINEGVDKIQQILADSDWVINWRGNKVHLQVEDLRVNEKEIKLTEEKKSYRLFNWVALTQNNYQKWNECDGVVERMLLLERMLRNHLIGFCKSMDSKPEQELIVKLQHVKKFHTVQIHDTQLLGFNVDFDANIDLPEFIGIGKGVSVGYGWLVRERVNLMKKGRVSFSKKRETTNKTI